MHEELPPDCNAGDTNQRESERRLIRMTVAACAPFHARSPVLGGQGRREQFDLVQGRHAAVYTGTCVVAQTLPHLISSVPWRTPSS